MTDTLGTSGFVAELVSLFPMSNKNAEGWIKRYTNVLNEIGLIDFKRLWKIFENEYNSTVTPPSAKWLKDAANRAKVGAGIGNLKDFKTITCAIRGGLYEFAYKEGEQAALDKKIAESDFYWFGSKNDCPEELKSKVQKMQNDFIFQWMKQAEELNGGSDNEKKTAMVEKKME